MENNLAVILNTLLNGLQEDDAGSFSLLLTIQSFISSLFEEYNFKPFQGFSGFINLIIKIISNPNEYDAKAKMLDVL